jgi:deoxyribodipyrimidine photolyase
MIDMEQEWRRFDPQGHYVRRWLPVLSQLPNEFIHQPWKAPPEVLEEAGEGHMCKLSCFGAVTVPLRFNKGWC